MNKEKTGGNIHGKKAVVLLSGGVDSSTTVAIVKEEMLFAVHQ